MVDPKFKQLVWLLAYPPDLCDHDGRATGTLRLNPLRAEVTCDHCGAILHVNPPSVAVRFCDTVALEQAFRRPLVKLEHEPDEPLEGTVRMNI
jgi:hypothetical protein